MGGRAAGLGVAAAPAGVAEVFEGFVTAGGLAGRFPADPPRVPGGRGIIPLPPPCWNAAFAGGRTAEKPGPAGGRGPVAVGPGGRIAGTVGRTGGAAGGGGFMLDSGGAVDRGTGVTCV